MLFYKSQSYFVCNIAFDYRPVFLFLQSTPSLLFLIVLNFQALYQWINLQFPLFVPASKKMLQEDCKQRFQQLQESAILKKQKELSCKVSFNTTVQWLYFLNTISIARD